MNGTKIKSDGRLDTGLCVHTRLVAVQCTYIQDDTRQTVEYLSREMACEC